MNQTQYSCVFFCRNQKYLFLLFDENKMKMARKKQKERWKGNIREGSGEGKTGTVLELSLDVRWPLWGWLLFSISRSRRCDYLLERSTREVKFKRRKLVSIDLQRKNSLNATTCGFGVLALYLTVKCKVCILNTSISVCQNQAYSHLYLRTSIVGSKPHTGRSVFLSI